ncbi:MAG: hypothetical protein ACRC33_19535 [Gemmataceae bacterium]
MNKRIKQIIDQSDSRYFTNGEMKEILAYTNTLPARFKAAGAVEKHEADAVRYCIDEMRARYPGLEKYHAKGWDRSYRDVQLVVRYIVQSMILDDSSVMEDKLLLWLRTMLAGVDLTPQFISDTYELLTEGFRRKLPEDAFALVEPFLLRTKEVLSDIPEPATASV